MLGDYIDLWEAHSTIEDLRARGGGGIVTTLLVYALERGLISEAVVVTTTSEEPWAQPTIARSTEEIIAAAGSKYVFVPYGRLVKQLKPDSAIVGLPCQIRAHRLDNIALRLGLFCGLSLSRQGMDYLLSKLRVDKNNIISLDYRAPGGGLLIKLKDGNEVRYDWYSWLAYFFTEKRCLYCNDFSNHYADISVGDRRPGWSNVIVRTRKGKDLFRKAVEEGFLEAHPLTREEFLKRVMSPLVPKEVKGGYINIKAVRVRGQWINYVPLSVLRALGTIIHRHIRALKVPPSENER